MATGIFGIGLLIDNVVLIAILAGVFALLFMIIKVMPIAHYSYPSSRVRVMRGRMLGSEKIRELAESMDFKDVIGSFEGTGYEAFVAGKTELSEIEKSLALNLAQDYRAIVGMCPKHAAPFFKMVSSRYDTENIKAIVAAKQAGGTASDFYPGPLSEAFLQKLNDAGGIAEMIELLKATNYKEAVESLPQEVSPIEFQKALDRHVFENLLRKRKIDEAARTAGIMQDSQYLGKIYGMQVDLLNLKIILRCLKDDIVPEKTKAMLLKNGYFISEKKAEALAESSDIGAALGGLEGTPYQAVLSEKMRDFEKSGSLWHIEKALDEFWAGKVKAYSIRQPFGLTPIACYLALKETEISNLRAILNGIRLGLPKEQIREMAIGV
ncbi:MAG: V-type ATPase subunit [Candidatus Diapherotrites archaeon]